MKKSQFKQLVRQVILEATENVNTNLTFKKKLYSQLAKLGFQQLGNEPRQYMEYYLNGFATIQCGVDVQGGSVRLEKYYDSERFDENNRTKEWPIPSPEKHDKFIAAFVKLCQKMQENIKGDESLFGGADDLAENSGNVQANKLSIQEKRKIGEAFAKVGLDGNGRFPKVEAGLAAVTNALASLGFNLDMVNGDQIRGDKGSILLSFRRSNDAGQDPFTEKDEIANSRISFNWENLSSNQAAKRFEILAYAS